LYDHVRGRVTRKDASRLEVVLEAGGVGYALRVSRPTLAQVPREGEECRLLVPLLVRESELALCGFAAEDERAVFRLLLGAPGIGAGTALAVLSSRSPGEVLLAIRDEDYQALTGIRGIGEKTARRTVLDLRKRAAELELVLRAARIASGVPEAEAVGATASVREDAVKALVALEWTRAEAEAAVREALQNSEFRIQNSEDVSELVRLALAGKSGGPVRRSLGEGGRAGGAGRAGRVREK